MLFENMDVGILPAMDVFVGGKATGSRWMGAMACFSQVCDLESMGGWNRGALFLLCNLTVGSVTWSTHFIVFQDPG